MRRFICLLAFLQLLLHIANPGICQVVINEITPSNQMVLMDEDGDYPDWIELYNSGPTPVSLHQYSISDDPQMPAKWIFPAGISIPASGFLLLYASGKDRKTSFDHWETVVNASDTWRYIKPMTEPDTGWRWPGFNDVSWSSGPGGIGYGDNDDSTLISVPANSVYMRRVFTIADTSEIASAVLHIDYDDAFVAYINGKEIARSNIGQNGTPVPFSDPALAEHEAHMYAGGSPEQFLIHGSLLKSFLINGNNVLSIQIHNVTPYSSDLSSLAWLTLAMKNPGSTYGPVPSWFTLNAAALHTNFKLSASGETILLSDPGGNIVSQLVSGSMLTDHSYGRQPDGAADMRYFSLPTPGSSNNSSTGYMAYTSAPVFSVDGGFYPGQQLLSLSCTTPGAVVRYTLDGNIPSATSPAYSVPILIDSTVVVTARSFHPSLLEGKPAVNSYFINDNSSQSLPVVSLSVPPHLFFDTVTGLYVKGPSADSFIPFFGANFWQEREVMLHIEYFDKSRQLGFEQDAGVEIYGNYSRSFPQKSMKLIARENYGNGSFDYPLFSDKDIHSYSQFILRNAGTDWNQAHMRDALVHNLALGATNCDMMAYQPCVVYLNGQYWGVYNMREKINKDYLAGNHGADPDSVDLLQYNGLVMSGDNDNFIQMGVFMLYHDLNIPANFAVIDNWLDLRNMADYFAMETWSNNWDWLTNNVRYWREDKAGKKWRYILWDLDNGLGGNWSYVANSLDTNIHKGWDYTSLIFSKLLQNTGFKNYFINRYADLLNSTLTPQHVNDLLANMRDSIDSEMPRHFARWGNGFNNPYWGLPGMGTYNDWRFYQMPELSAFAGNRQTTARNHIQATFGLKKQVPVTLNVYPPGAGKIRISTIIPESMPWGGIYFDSVPVTITAIPSPGYQFAFWQSDIIFTSPEQDSSLVFVPDTADVFTAYFFGAPVTSAITFSEINYHSADSADAGDWVELYNYGNWPLDISFWKFKDGDDAHSFVMPLGTALGPGEYLVLSQDTLKFSLLYPGVNNISGPFGFGLSSSGEQLRLINSSMEEYLSMSYFSATPWPSGADGTGKTLERLSPFASPDDPSNWFTGCPGGSPGGPFIACDNSSVNQMPDDILDAVTLFPNPAKGRFTIWTKGTDLMGCRFFLNDIRGNRLADIPLDTELKVVETGLRPGIYFYSIRNEKGFLQTGKLVLL